MMLVRDYVERSENLNLLEQLWEYKYDYDTDCLKRGSMTAEGVHLVCMLGILALVVICFAF
ncbi:MAG: hypothetical protein IJ629_02315 [Clostridia bacterium]|nr:hypothetical protein [Clostridia bacterium]